MRSGGLTPLDIRTVAWASEFLGIRDVSGTSGLPNLERAWHGPDLSATTGRRRRRHPDPDFGRRDAERAVEAAPPGCGAGGAGGTGVPDVGICRAT